MLFKRPLSLLLILKCLILSLPLVADLNISTRVLDNIEAQYNKFFTNSINTFLLTRV